MKTSWDRFLEAHGDRLFRLSLRLSAGCHADAEDLAQEALLAAYQSLPHFAGRARLTTYLYSITLNCWRKRHRRDGERLIPLKDDELAGGSALDTLLTRLSLDAAMAQLTEVQREAFVLVKAEGLTSKEAAAVLKVPQGTVQSRVHDATLRLRALLSEEEENHHEDR